ncbi:MAG: hypothetical protein D6696_11395 [Acidobacteria bacterium]|nr:MAG: hypothetical protein D6696_11395 [Acidobacteriota bacterium]
MPRLRIAVACAATVLAATPFVASGQPSPPPAPPASAVHGHFVVLGAAGGRTVAYARAVIEPAYGCPAVSGGAGSITMTTRDNPHHFPVVVCEAQIGFDQDLALLLGDGTRLALPRVKRNPQRILVFGDTGCKLPEHGSGEGCPAGSPAEPFRSLAAAAASGPAADVILHMGDYNYRGTGGGLLFTEREDGGPRQVSQWPYDAGDGSGAGEQCEQAPGTPFYSQNAANANHPDAWSYWRDDFFTAAADLLPKAPWIFARGNHELCSRAGPGWFYFLDPHSELGDGQLRCPTPEVDRDPIDNVLLTEPYAVDLGSLTVLVLDSANACDSFTEPIFTGYYQQQLQALATLAPRTGVAWLISHRPLWGVTEYSATESTACSRNGEASSTTTWGCINRMLQTALDRVPGGALPPSVELLLAGHMHRFQSLTFPGGSRPPLVVVGSSGVELDGSPPLGVISPSPAVGGLTAQVLSTGDEVYAGGAAGGRAAFGYLEITYRGNGGWSGVLHNPPEKLTIATCGSALAAAGAVCRLAPGIRATPPSAQR